MPIKPENKSRYPKNWKEIRERILKRANNRCEFCGVTKELPRLFINRNGSTYDNGNPIAKFYIP